MKTQTQGRLILLAIAAAFFLPIMAAVYLYFAPDGWRPGGYTQYGTLVQPPVPLPDKPLLAADKAPLLREVWSMLVIAPAACDQTCQSALIKIRQIRLALGPTPFMSIIGIVINRIFLHDTIVDPFEPIVKKTEFFHQYIKPG